MCPIHIVTDNRSTDMPGIFLEDLVFIIFLELFFLHVFKKNSYQLMLKGKICGHSTEDLTRNTVVNIMT